MKSRRSSFLAVAFALASLPPLLGCAHGPGFPPAVAVRAPDPAQGLTVLLYLGPDSGEDAGDFHDALVKALTEAGMRVVSRDERRPPAFDIAIAYTVRSNHSGFVAGDQFPVSWEIGLSSAVRSRNENYNDRWLWSSWAARYGASMPKTKLAGVWVVDRDRDGELFEPMRSCFEDWEREVSAAGRNAPNGREGTGVLVMSNNSNSIAVRGASTLGSLEPEDASGAAYFLVNRLTTCPGFAETAKVIQDSGVSAASRMENLPADRLMNLCTASFGGDGSSETLGTGALRDIADACDAAIKRDRRNAPLVQKLRRDRDAKAAADAAFNASHLSNGCARETPVHCGYGDNVWCCPNAYPVCGGCGNSCCPYVPQQASTVYVPVPTSGGGSQTIITGPDSCACQGFVCGGTAVPGCAVSHVGATCDCGHCVNQFGWTHANICN